MHVTRKNVADIAGRTARDPLKATLEGLAGPFRNPELKRSEKLDVAAMPAGPLQAALAESASRLPASGEGESYLQGVYALYATDAQKKKGSAAGYAVIAYGGTKDGAWSAAEYFDKQGRKLSAKYDTA
jgi:hypothetical protein